MTKRQTTHTVLVHSELSSTRLPPVIPLKQDASLVLIALTPFLPSSVLHFVLPLHTLSVHSCLFSLPPGSLRLFRQDLSSSVKLQSAHRSLGCLERLTMTSRQNPADLQLIALFHQPSTVILCTQNSPTSSPLAVPPQSSTAHIFSTRPQILY